MEDAIKTAYSTAYSRLLVLAKSGRIGDIVSVDSVCTSLEDGAGDIGADLRQKQNSICAWGPCALLPVFQLLGISYKSRSIITKIINEELNFDGFTKIDFSYENAVASIKVAKAAKAEGELIITGTKGYIYVPAPKFSMFIPLFFIAFLTHAKCNLDLRLHQYFPASDISYNLHKSYEVLYRMFLELLPENPHSQPKSYRQ